MGRIHSTCAILVCALTSNLAVAAGFDCDKSRSTIEFTICADPVLSELDSELKRVFEIAQTEHSGVNGDTGKRLDPVGFDQMNWIKNHRNKCTDNICLRKEYKSRISFIKSNWQVQ